MNFDLIPIQTLEKWEDLAEYEPDVLWKALDDYNKDDLVNLLNGIIKSNEYYGRM